MRCLTAARAKAGGRKIRGAPLREYPREGTLLRHIYDALQANKGAPVEIGYGNKSTLGTCLVQLENFYGLDVRRVRNGSSRTGRKSTYVLAGEWFGRVYVDYIAERMDSIPFAAPSGETAASVGLTTDNPGKEAGAAENSCSGVESRHALNLRPDTLIPNGGSAERQAVKSPNAVLGTSGFASQAGVAPGLQDFLGSAV